MDANLLFICLNYVVFIFDTQQISEGLLNLNTLNLLPVSTHLLNQIHYNMSLEVLCL